MPQTEAGPETWPEQSATYSSKELPPEGQTIKLRREELVARKEMRHLGDVEIRTEVGESPGRLEVEALKENVEVEHVPIGRTVSVREEPRYEGDELVVPVYEEQLVVSKRLVLREELRIRRIREVERRLFEDTLKREHVVVEDPENLVYERYPSEPDDAEQGRQEGFLEGIKRKMMQP